MIKRIIFLLMLSTSVANSAVRFNPMTRFWEGNICANYSGWTYVNFQPIGSFCQFMLPNGILIQGQIVNQ